MLLDGMKKIRRIFAMAAICCFPFSAAGEELNGQLDAAAAMTTIAATSSQTQPAAKEPDLPGVTPVLLAPISPDEMERRIASRLDQRDQNKGIEQAAPSRPNKAGSTMRVSALTTTTAPIPTSVAELARALKYDPVLIYEFVRNNIEYLPIWGALKGSEGTLTDGIGTGFDIAQLTADLINADPNHGATATLVRGTIAMPAATAASWLSLNGMNGCPLAYTFSSGGIPVSYTSTNAPACTGTVNFTGIGHVWVKVKIGAATYEIDPSFKTHTKVNATVDLPTVTGYNRTSFLSAACTSCNTNPNVVTTLNRAGILNPSNVQSYPKFARNLLSYLQANNIHDLKKVIGGYSIDAIYPTALPSSLPYTVASRIADPFTIDGTWKGALLVNFNGISQLFSSDAIYGKRLTVTFNSGNFPQLNLDGAVIQTGTTAVAPGSAASVNLSMCLPFSGVNCSSGSVDGSGKALWCNNPPAGAMVRCNFASILSGGTYAVTNSWGPVSHNMVQRHQVASMQAANAGIPSSAEANLGETLTTMGFTYSEQNNLYRTLSEDGQRNGGYAYFIVGIAGHTGVGGGPFVDLPANVVFFGVNPVLNGDGTYSGGLNTDNFLDNFYHDSALESTSVNQISGAASVSTAKLMDIGISQTTNNEIYDIRSCSDYNTYSALLVSYTSSALSAVQNLACNLGYRVVLPRRGNLTDPAVTTSPKWTGAGYYAYPYSGGAPQWNGSVFWAYISGGYAGGFSGFPLSADTLVNFAQTYFDGFELTIVSRATPPPASIGIVDQLYASYQSIVQPIGRFVSDPVDQFTGSFISRSSDISIGESSTPRQLSFERAYISSDISPSAIGTGWRHGFDLTAQLSSDGVRPAGAYDAWDAAEMLIVKMVNRDLASDPTLPVVNIAVASIGNRWLGDRLVNNVINVNLGTGGTSFQRIADDTYNPAQQSTARIVAQSPSWKYTTKDGMAVQFGAVGSDGLARATSIAQPNGLITNFSYSGTQVSQVSNNLGRRLNLNWTGNKITSVTDTPLAGAATRTVIFGYNGNLLQQVTDTRGGRTLYCYDSAGRMTAYYLPTEGSGTNCAAAGAHITNVYDSLGRVKQQVDGGGHVTDLYLAGKRAETVTHPGSGVADIRLIRYIDDFGNIVRDVSPRTGLATTFTFDALSRIVRTDYPEGNAVEMSYDARSNPVQTCAIPKTAGAYPACNTGAGSTHIWSTVAYNEGASVWTCASINTCNQPATSTDPLGSVTSYTYKADGQLDTVTAPTPSGYAGAPKTVNSYTAVASLSGNINLLTQRQVTSTGGSSPSIVTTFGYDTAANGLTLRTATLDPTGLNYTTSYGYDGYGNQTTVKGPRTDVDDTVTTAYDADRHPVTTTFPNPGSGSPVTQVTYNPNGWVTSTARKLGGSWMVSCATYTASGQADTSFGPFTVASPTDCTFSGNTAVPKVTYGYDGADRLISTTVAENAGDRITQLALFPDNRVQTTTIAYGTPAAASQTTAYSNNGYPTSITDARGNVSALTYDGFDRLALTQYPGVGGGAPSATDVVAFAYDKRNAMTKRSIRGTSDVSGSCSQCIAFSYDELGRLKQKTVPAIAANIAVVPNVAAVAGYNVYYHYDLIGRLDSQGYASGTPELTFGYDNASRVTTATQYGRTVGYSYGTPAQGLARKLTWPSSAGTMLTCTDALGRVAQIKEAADCTTTTGQLVAYGYDDLSRRTSVTRPSGANTAYTYKTVGALDTLSHGLAGGAAVNYGFGYNRVLQIANRSTDNDLYAWTNNYNVTRSFTANGLDQYSQIMGDTQAWDARGNLLSYRGVSYGYDGENRIASAVLGSGTATTGYDPSGRLRQISSTAGAQLLYDGSQLIGEYDASSGAIVGRYVPGPGADETVVAYDAGGVKSWYHADAQGSVVAASDATGAATSINQYGPFGEPGLVSTGRNQGRLRYTGQIYVPELAPIGGPSQPLMSYKARIYAPKLGRFLQTDPIGAADDANLYAYVRNDPINRGDPSGLVADATAGIIQGGLDTLYSIVPPSASWRPSDTGSAAYMEGYNAAPRVWTETALGLATMGDSLFATTGTRGALAAGGAANYSAIGSTGQVGEQWLANNLGGTSQAYFSTSQGARYVDQFANGIANESKVGYTSLTQSVQIQISKDVELMQTQQVQGVNWHFFDSPVTGLGGPSQPLLNSLQQNGINVIKH